MYSRSFLLTVLVVGLTAVVATAGGQTLCTGHLEDAAPPDGASGNPSTVCFNGVGSYASSERFLGDDQLLTGVGFWFVHLGGLPASPAFLIRIYDSDGSCPLTLLHEVDAEVVQIGPGSGTVADPIEYFVDFSDNGATDFMEEDGVEYMISIQSSNCPGEGEGSWWASGMGDGNFGCALAPDFGIPDWEPLSLDLAMYTCSVAPSFCGAADIKDVGLPDGVEWAQTSLCFFGVGRFTAAERFFGDGRLLTGFGFWFSYEIGVPDLPTFLITIYDTDGTCPLNVLHEVDAQVVQVGPGSGTVTDPMECFVDFADNGAAGFFKQAGVEYMISVESTNCPGDGELAGWATGAGDGLLGCLIGPEFNIPDWVTFEFAEFYHDLAMYFCNEEPSSAEGGTGAVLRAMLSRPSPNPTTGAMTYAVSLERETHVQVRVIDVTGRVVDRPVDRRLPAGIHTLSWSATDSADRDLPAGIYYLSFEANGEKQTRKFVVLK